ncbi:MAG TPA: SagB/ThcOx family dehydrogenase [Patescibacteria group bacterium]|nr:SagB/ThcOx family dehydrogenase [Patescibacteria group bacterium]
MKRHMIPAISIVLAALYVYSAVCCAQEAKSVRLPDPVTEGGTPLMQALKQRKSTREFGPKELPPQVLANLLWAAYGINRPASGGRTAPSTMDMQEIDIYVAKADAVYLFDAKANTLTPVVAGDLRSLTGLQPFVKDAPVNLVYVADTSRMTRLSADSAELSAACDTGFISQNVYLFCASEGLATVVRGWLDKPALAHAMKLRPEQKVILAQTVGYPGK